MMYAVKNRRCHLRAPQSLGPGPTACQRPAGHSRADGHRDGTGKDVWHVWQDHGWASPGEDVGAFWRCAEGMDWS
jgi:hypothetical protein